MILIFLSRNLNERGRKSGFRLKFNPQEIRGAFERAVKADKLYIINIMIDRQTNVSMGTAINAIVERE